MTVKKSPRIAFLDELRGLCVFLMVFRHAFYTLGYLIDVPFFRWAFEVTTPLNPFFAGIFIALCGFCCTLSRSNLRRGALLAVVAAGVSLVMWIFFPEEPIWFGVLHLLSVCILLYAALEKVFKKVPPWVGVLVCAVLFALCWHLPVQDMDGVFGIRGVWTVEVPRSVYSIPWLYPLGLGRIPGVQSDYYPLLPWMFLFLGGSFAGRWAPHFPEALRRSHVKPLAFLGRHALLVYVVHQPIIYGTGMLVSYLVQKGS